MFSGLLGIFKINYSSARAGKSGGELCCAVCGKGDLEPQPAAAPAHCQIPRGVFDARLPCHRHGVRRGRRHVPIRQSPWRSRSAYPHPRPPARPSTRMSSPPSRTSGPAPSCTSALSAPLSPFHICPLPPIAGHSKGGRPRSLLYICTFPPPRTSAPSPQQQAAAKGGCGAVLSRTSVYLYICTFLPSCVSVPSPQQQGASRGSGPPSFLYICSFNPSCASAPSVSPACPRRSVPPALAGLPCCSTLGLERQPSLWLVLCCPSLLQVCPRLARFFVALHS
jgi:hypothetical protein